MKFGALCAIAHSYRTQFSSTQPEVAMAIRIILGKTMMAIDPLRYS